jgi:16S rRNA (guanine527-N7)-methyltransferase
MEEVAGSYDAIVTRAVAPMRKLKSWLSGKLDRNSTKAVSGLFCLKGGDLSEEIAESQLNVKLYNISDFFNEDFFETKNVVQVRKL